MVSIGDQLELNFTVKSAHGDETRTGSFRELVTRPTIVSVYMRNNTSSCDRQIQQMKEIAPQLDAMGVALIGVSKDTVGSHSKYACKLELEFPLVSDPDHRFAKATDSLVEKKMYGKTFWGPVRAAYLIDPSGAVLGLIEKVDSAAHADQLLALAKKAG
ncbi:redoxin domain-containing protein [Pelagicoccus sp. SDUM812003]|uniref:peroxiredoxin n=1 Tax=Pelagicoccus sp. SDUM812003 TaxID=3041267 RepID=UPI00281051FB|nr:redoxin domain-containing protein [Pelagicoccus sp. SDUM812003]MDQ8202444.1 redoxin domain-containing protein [Pelagicoccus sp. SDUM812003]